MSGRTLLAGTGDVYQVTHIPTDHGTHPTEGLCLRFVPPGNANTSAPFICVVDDDRSVVEAVVSLMESVGFAAAGFCSAESFLDSAHVSDTACLILDVFMPGMGGLELQRRLAADCNRTPIVFITGHPEVDVATNALRLGAVAFLLKPFSDTSLLDAIRAAVGTPVAATPN